MSDARAQNYILVVSIKGKKKKILLVKKMRDIKSLDKEINKFFPGTISFFDKLFQEKKYTTHSLKMAPDQFQNAICNIITNPDWNSCAMEIIGGKIISRYAHGFGIVYNTHRINDVIVTQCPRL